MKTLQYKSLAASILLLGFLTMGLAGCSTLSKLKFWGKSESDSEKNNDEEGGSSPTSDTSVSGDDSGASKNQGSTQDNESPQGRSLSSDATQSSEPKKKHERRKPKSLTMEGMERSQADMWAKVDELEQVLQGQKERMKVLEKGLMLGIVPDELRQDAKVRSKKLELTKSNLDEESSGAQRKSNTKADLSSGQKPGAMPLAVIDRTKKGYEERSTQAQEYFRAGRYGKAIAEYGVIQREFKDFDTQGSSYFWVALSWLNLKELQSSQQSFESFLTEYPNSPLVQRAHFYLARVEAQSGLNDKAVGRLKKIVNEHPDDDASEMAKLELEQMKRNL